MKNKWIEIPHLESHQVKPGYYWFYKAWANGHGFQVFHVFKSWGDKVLINFVDANDETVDDMIEMGYYPISRVEPPFELPPVENVGGLK